MNTKKNAHDNYWELTPFKGIVIVLFLIALFVFLVIDNRNTAEAKAVNDQERKIADFPTDFRFNAKVMAVTAIKLQQPGMIKVGDEVKEHVVDIDSLYTGTWAVSYVNSYGLRREGYCIVTVRFTGGDVTKSANWAIRAPQLIEP